jgi:hypothetical protein
LFRNLVLVAAFLHDPIVADILLFVADLDVGV